jgi:hypothetical protein
MLACRQVGSDTFKLLAHAPREDVLFFTGTSNTAHDANGVGWYYSDSYSWGFAKQGDPLKRGSCDTESINPTQRLCWHTSNGNLSGGWRCGSATSLNGSATWERVVLHAD